MKTLKFKPYFIEPLRSMKKMSTIRKSDKGLKKGDVVKCVVDDGSSKAYRKVKKIEQVKFKNLPTDTVLTSGVGDTPTLIVTNLFNLIQ